MLHPTLVVRSTRHLTVLPTAAGRSPSRPGDSRMALGTACASGAMSCWRSGDTRPDSLAAPVGGRPVARPELLGDFEPDRLPPHPRFDPPAAGDPIEDAQSAASAVEMHHGLLVTDVGHLHPNPRPGCATQPHRDRAASGGVTTPFAINSSAARTARQPVLVANRRDQTPQLVSDYAQLLDALPCDPGSPEHTPRPVRYPPSTTPTLETSGCRFAPRSSWPPSPSGR